MSDVWVLSTIHVLKPPLLQPACVMCNVYATGPDMHWNSQVLRHHRILTNIFPNEYLIQITSCVCTAFDESLIDTLESLTGRHGLQMSQNLQ